MSDFDSILNEYKEPTADDITIYVPGVVGGNKSAAAPSGSPAGASTPPPVSSTPEPAPQLPEGSDPDEPATVDEAEGEPEQVPASDPTPAPAELPETDPTPDPSSPELVEHSNAATQPAEFPVIDRKNSALSFEGKSSQLKQFPKVLVEQMRQRLVPTLGKDFSTDLSQNSVVVAFVIASLGTELETDINTAYAVEAFKQNDPKTDLVDKRTSQLLAQQIKVEAVLKKMVGRLGEVADTNAVLEIGQAYLLADRTAQLDTAGIMPETIDVTQKRVVAARDNVRTRVNRLQQDEKIRSGRPIR